MSEQKTIAEVASFGAVFLIPDYQRGYRWGNTEVHDLLCDIDEMDALSDAASSSGTQKGQDMYCLQPVVFDASKKDEGMLIVVDGQQRLTTLYLVMHYITRELSAIPDIDRFYGTGTFDSLTKCYRLEYVNAKRQKDFEDMLGEIDKPYSPNFKSIDLFYMVEAYKTICDWMTGSDIPTLVSFAKKLYGRTTVIWYEVDESTDGKPGDYFAKINSGKIPLTNSELIKANLMLGEYALTVAEQGFETKDTDLVLVAQQKKDFEDIKRKRLENERMKMARQWDEIEETLRSREFWSFISQENDKYNDTRIDFLFDMVADEEYKTALADENGNPPSEGIQDFRTFNKDRGTFVIISRYLEKQRKAAANGAISVSAALWKDVWDKYMTLKEWFMDRPLYHYVGYIILFCKDDAASLLRKAKGKGKKETKRIFLDIIRNDIGIKSGTTKEDFYNYIDNLDYDDGKSKNAIKKVLVLFNIISILLDTGTESLATRDTFFPFARYREEDWDAEHIHSRAESTYSKSSAKLYIGYLDRMIANLAPKTGGEESSEYKTMKECKALYDKALKDGKDETDAVKDCADAIAVAFDADFGDDVLNSIGNIALLDSRTNRSYGNLPFFMKRMIIKDIVSGKDKTSVSRFIPLCTRNVFDKSYSKTVSNMLHWTADDAEQYASEIKAVLWQWLGGAK